MNRLETAADLAKLKKQIVAQRKSKETWLAVCAGTGCRAYGAESLRAADAVGRVPPRSRRSGSARRISSKPWACLWKPRE